MRITDLFDREAGHSHDHLRVSDVFLGSHPAPEELLLLTGQSQLSVPITEDKKHTNYKSTISLCATRSHYNIKSNQRHDYTNSTNSSTLTVSFGIVILMTACEPMELIEWRNTLRDRSTPKRKLLHCIIYTGNTKPMSIMLEAVVQY